MYRVKIKINKKYCNIYCYQDLSKEPEYLILAEPRGELIKLDQDKIVVVLENIQVM